ncbi:MAG: MBL fold metallo-hydrolase [Akkermansiaceae bacterium]|nr:MBL fold metallo-hydrolase [Akkermansiaceae bacterium]NNM29479.1 MBL fold metallo-hydrolase [Akkermansiaceae bacterium]
MPEENGKRLAQDYAGLKPRKGWPNRNYKFFRYRLVPQIFKKLHGDPQHPVVDAPPDGKARVTWIGHASFLVQFEEHSILFDPNWAKWLGIVKRMAHPGILMEHMPEVDLVLVSHAHFDHLHKKSLKGVDARDGIVVPRGSGSLVRRLGFPAVREMKIWEERRINGLRILHTPSHHWGARFGHDTHRDYGGFVVASEKRSVFHCGDSAYFEGFKKIGAREDIDIALMPIGAYDTPSGRDVHMNPEEAVQAFEDLGARLMIPMHYGTFQLSNEPPEEPLQRLLAEAERRGLSDRVVVPHAGEGVEL